MNTTQEHCERCNKEITKQECPFDDLICEECVNTMLAPSPSAPHDWSHIDFERGDYKS